MSVTAGGIRVRILGDDSDLQKTLGDSTKQLAKYGAAAAAAGAAAAAALTVQGLKAVDAQAKLARQLDTSIDGLRALQIAASDAGVSSGVMSSAMERLNGRIGEAQRGTGAAAESFKRLGVDVQALSEMDADERMATLAEAMQKGGLSTSQMADELRQLGIRNGEVVNLMLAGGDAIRGYRQEVDDLGLSLSEVDAAKVEMANDAFSRMGMLTEGLQQQLAVEAAPYLKAISEQITQAVGDMGGLGQISENVFDFLIRGAGFVGDALHGWRLILKGAEAAYQGLGLVGVTVANEIVQAFDDAISGAKEILNDMIRAANKIPGINMEEMVTGQSAFAASMQESADAVRATFEETTSELHNLLMQPLPSENIKKWAEGVKEQAQIAAEAMASAQAGGTEGGEGGGGLIAEEQKAEEARQAKIQDRLERIREANMAEIELLHKKFEEENAIVNEALENQLIAESEWEELSRDQKQRHEDELTEIEDKGRRQRERQAELEARNKERILGDSLSGLTTLMNSESRKMFEIGKAAAISQSLIATYQGASEALKLGWPLGPIAATAITAAGMANVQSIKSQSFGSGGSSGGGGGSVTQNVNAQSEAVQGQQESSRNMYVQGIDPNQMFSGRQLVELINEAQQDGAQLRIGTA